MKIWLAIYESANFEFSAFGRTKGEAMKAIRKGLKKHTDQYELERGWFCPDDIFALPYELGHAYRDGGDCLTE